MSSVRALSAPLLVFAAASVLLPAGTRLHLAPDRTLTTTKPDGTTTIHAPPHAPAA